VGPTCHSLTLPFPCAAQCAVMKTEVSRSSTPLCVAVVEGDPVFPAGDVAKSSTTPSRARHLPQYLPRPRFSPFLLPWSPWIESEQAHCLQPIRELLSVDSKSTATKARQPS